MTTEAIDRSRSGVNLSDRDERARAAVKAFRAMQHGLTSYARAITGNPKARIEISSGPPRTDGNIIYYRPPIRLGDKTPHERQICDKRDIETGLLRCVACSIREEILVNIYHEIAHIVFGTFAPISNRAKSDALKRAVGEWGSEYSDRIKTRIATAPGNVTSTYLGLSSLISPFLPHLVNTLEDARIDKAMFTARKGIKKMLVADTYQLLREGFEGSDGKVVQYKEQPLNAQIQLGLYMSAGGYENWEQYFHPQIATHIADPELQKLLNNVRAATEVEQVYEASFPILARLRELNYLLMPDEQPKPETSDEPKEQEEQDNDTGDSSGEDSDSPEQHSEDEVSSDVDDPSGDSESKDGGESDDPSQDEASSESGDGRSSGSSDDGTPSESDDTGDSSESSGGLQEEESDDSDVPSESREFSDSGESDGQSGEEESSSNSGGEGPSNSDASEDREAGESDSSEDESGTKADPDPGGSSGEAEEGEGDSDSERGGSNSDSTSDSELSAGGDLQEEVHGVSDSSNSGQSSSDSASPSTGAEGGEGESVSEVPEQGNDGSNDVPGTPTPDNGTEAKETSSEVSPQGDGEDVQSDDSSSDETDATGKSDELVDSSSGAPDSPSQEGDPDEAGDVEPVDSGADAGLGGIPISEYGTVEEVKEVLGKVHESHCDISDPDSNKRDHDGNAADERAVNIAVIQGQYFETPSAHVDEVTEYEDGNGPIWTVKEKLSERDQIRVGIKVDVDVPESILGPSLLRLRRIFSDNKLSAHERHRRSGKVDARVLGRRAWSGDDRLFTKKRLPGKKDYAVLISIDVSSSNLGSNLALVKRAAFAQAELLDRLGVDFAVFAHSCGLKGRMARGAIPNFSMDVWKIKDWRQPWDSERQELLSGIAAVGGNLDGHALEYGRKMLDRVEATDKILLYYTDGKMPAANKEEELEILQREIRTCKQKGYTLLGVGVKTDSPVRHGLDTVQVDDDSDLPRVVEHLGRRLTGAVR